MWQKSYCQVKEHYEIGADSEPNIHYVHLNERNWNSEDFEFFRCQWDLRQSDYFNKFIKRQDISQTKKFEFDISVT